MGRLWLIGLGLGPKGLSIQAQEAAAGCDARFLETYTSVAPAGDALAELEARVGRVEPVGRDVVEDGSPILEAAAGEGQAALLVPGDPLAATTHADLRLRAVRAGLEVRVVHGASALVAVPGLLGLSHYKFGRGTTLVTPRPGFAPESPYDVLKDNGERGLHTLVLLDTGDGEGHMTAGEGIRFLLDVEARRGEGVLDGDRRVCVVARAGRADVLCRAGPAGEMVEEDFGPPPHALVVPGELHFKEEESLRVLAGSGAG